jgi:general stress protein 26
MEEHQIRQWSVALMETAEAAYLTTVDEAGYPRTRAMLNLRNRRQWGALAPTFDGHREDFLVYFSTNTSSTKVRQIRANPHVSVYFCHPAQFHGLMLGGDIEIVTDPTLKHRLWQDGWEVYYPRGRDDPDYTILRLLPAFASGWTGEGPFAFEIGARK